ncbi:MAG: M12 family metallopeptidase [Bacteroidota bacterium]
MKSFFVLSTVMVIGVCQAQSQVRVLRRPGCSAPVSNTLFQAVDTTKSRGVADNYLTWDPGQIIRVKFMPGGGKVLRDKVTVLAKEWEKYANVKFQFLPDNEPNTHIRVKLGKGLGHNSAVGVLCKTFAPDEHTLHLDTLYLADLDFYWSIVRKENLPKPHNENLFRTLMSRYPNHWNEKELYATVVHEFGHALGLKHEQSFPGAIKWNKSDSVYDYYEESQGWDRNMVNHNVFDAVDQFYTNGSAYDPKSIMHYSVEAWQTTNGYSVGNNYALSEGDKSIIAALYPRNPAEQKRVVPKVQIDNFKGLQVTYNAERKGLVIIPKIDMKTNARLGEVWFVARLVYEDDFYVRTSSQYYNWGGAVATYYKLNLMPNTTYGINQTTKNFEMFLPAQYIPELGDSPIYVEFSVVLDDPTNDQKNRLMYMKSSSTMKMPKR